MSLLAVMLGLGLNLQMVSGAPPVKEPVADQNVAPDDALGLHDVPSEFRLPPLRNRQDDPLRSQVDHLQVMERAARLQLSGESATEAWGRAGQRWKETQQPVPELLPVVTFNGTKISALNSLLRRDSVSSVKVTSPVLRLDAPLQIARNGLVLDLGTTHLEAASPMPYLLRIEGSQRVTVRGGVLTEGRGGVLISRSRQVTLSGMTLDGLNGVGIVLADAGDALLRGNTLRHLHGAPVLLVGDTTGAMVTANEIEHNLGPSNWDAGVVLTDRNVDMASDPANLFSADGFWVRQQPMAERLHIPQNNVIAYNHIVANSSSGVYSDGSVRNIIVGNRIEGNSKEGLCLDDGSSADVVAWNIFRGNGQRWGKSDLDLQRDYVLQSGRLPDGTSVAKLPAVSIDNAAYNQVVFNELDRNFGGGIKMVRTGLYNVLGLNLLLDNNEGQSERFHFFGIELGSATADAPSPELDFGPSRGNIVFGNNIRGKHYAGIFFASGSDSNDVFDNSIFGAVRWAMESARPQPNATLNNLSNLPSRNVETGLDPTLSEDTRGVYDEPRKPEPTPGSTPQSGTPQSGTPQSGTPQR